MNQLQQRGGGLLAAAVLRQLMDRAFLTPADAVDRGFSVVDASMSHQSLLVRVGGRPRFFVKRADPIRSGGRDLRVEARFYSQIAALPSIRELVPCCRLIGEAGATIIMDAPSSEPLDIATLLCGGGAMRDRADADRAVTIVRQYGMAVARVHALAAPPRLGPAPWILEMLEPRWGALDWLPEPCRLLLQRMTTDSAYRAAFSDARRRWSPTGLVHGDLRCANVLVDRTGSPPRLWLVDWELACHGDRAWDLAALIAELIAISLLWHRHPEPWRAVRESAAVFFSGYREVWGASDSEWTALIHRAVPFAGVKLVQTLLEIGHVDDGSFPRAESILAPWIDEFLASSPSLAGDLSGAATGITSG